jgi:lactoylglutathione lyase
MTLTMKAPLEIGISVTNLERATAFYQNVLGFERVSEATLSSERAEAAGFGRVAFRMVRMQTNYGERIKLLETDPRAAETSISASILATAGISYLTFVVADIEHAIDRLRKAGATLLANSPVQTRPGTRLMFFRDSEGNPLELVQYDDLSAYRPDIA